MSHDTTIPVRDESPQRDNSDKTAEGMANSGTGTPATGRESRENQQGEEPSGYRGENPATAGTGSTKVDSATPENANGRLNPSAPGNTGITPNTTME